LRRIRFNSAKFSWTGINLLLAALLLGFSSLALFAQSEAQIQSDDVHRVGQHLSCQCGSCSENLNCNMSGGQCHFCKPSRTKIFQMQSQGKSDADIIASFVSEYGQKIFRADPNNWFWLVPYISLGLGAIVVWMVLKKITSGPKMAHAAAGGAPLIDDDPDLAKYRDTIEKDLEKLE